MTARHRLPGIVLTLALAAAVGAFAWWLVATAPTAPKSDKPPPAANVEKVVKEDDLARVIVAEKAAERIGLAVGAVELKPVRRVRVYGGEVTIPEGRRIPVTASLAGTLDAPAGGMLKLGATVKAGAPLFHLQPLLSPDSRVNMQATLATAEGLVKTADKRIAAAKMVLDRAKSAMATSGGRSAVDAAQGAFEVAQEEKAVAVQNAAVLAKVLVDLEKGTTSPVPVPSPITGIVRAITGQPGQAVPAGAPLCEVVDLSALWVRVPVPVGDLDGLAKDEPASVGKLSDATHSKKDDRAERIPAPPTANPLSGTVDLFFEMKNPAGALTPGQRVSATLPLNDPAESAVVPWSAVVTDIHGNTWVFAETAPRTFYRRRVVVKYTDPADLNVAVLDADTAPKAGTRVATKGVQELFGAETGFVK